MSPRETENNAYAKFWSDKQRALWYVIVILEWSIVRFDPSVVTVKQSSVVRQNLFYNYFGNLITGRLIEGGRYGGSLRTRSRVLARLVSLAQIGELAPRLLWWPLYGECLDLARRIGWEYVFDKTSGDEW